jgi:beta-phosphoglucomutase-like phosphatase (HAD superfamily)
MPRALLFDLGGVLVDDGPIRRRILAEILAAEGLAPAEGSTTESDPRESVAERLRRAFVAAGRELAETDLARLGARQEALFRMRVSTEGYLPVAGARALVAAAAAGGVALAVVAAAARDEIYAALRGVGLEGSFAVVVGGDEGEPGPPDPARHLAALARLNLEPRAAARLLHPHEGVAISASPPEIAAARAAGLATVGVASEGNAAALAGADWVVREVAKISLAALRARFAVEGTQATGTRPGKPSS